MTKILEDLNWRYATKKFDPAKRLPEEDVEELLEALRLAPSSFGIQPWKFVVVNDKKTREKLREHSWNQPQVTDASHLIVLCALKDTDEMHVRKFVESIAETRNMSVEALKGYEDIMVGFLKGMSKSDVLEWSKKQVYIALGVLLAAAAQRRIDACPMEGFDRKKYDEILGLEKEGLTSVVLCPVGHRSSDDPVSAKVRFGKKDLFIFK